MKKSERRFISMCLAVSHFYSQRKTQLELDAVIARLFQEFFTNKVQLDEAVQVQNGYTTEAAKQKQIEEDEMIEATIRYAYRGYVYAVEKGLPGLMETFSVCSGDLHNLSDVEVHSTCLSVYGALSKVDPAAIAEYSVIADDLVLLKKEIDDFGAFIAKPRSGIITRSQATAKIAEMVKIIKALLKQRLDKMIYSLPDTMVELKNEYRAARMIINPKGGKTNSNDETNVDE